jgi:hypothetical protein
MKIIAAFQTLHQPFSVSRTGFWKDCILVGTKLHQFGLGFGRPMASAAEKRG